MKLQKIDVSIELIEILTHLFTDVFNFGFSFQTLGFGFIFDLFSHDFFFTTFDSILLRIQCVFCFARCRELFQL